MALELDPTLLRMLACPACHSSFIVDYEAKELVCASLACSLAYPIRENIPILLVDEARDARSPRGLL